MYTNFVYKYAWAAKRDATTICGQSRSRSTGRLAQYVERRTREHRVLGLYRLWVRVPGWTTKKSLIVFVKPRSRVTVLYTEHVKEPGGILSSFVLYPCTIPRNNSPSSGGVAQMGNR